MRTGLVVGSVALAAGAATWLALGRPGLSDIHLPFFGGDDAGPPDEPPGPGQARLGQLNLHNLFDSRDDPNKQDDVPTQAQVDAKLGKLALAITGKLGAPDVLTVQEVENVEVLEKLADEPRMREYDYKAVLIEGSDPRGIDVGVLYRADRMNLRDATQSNPTVESASGRATRAFTRPPLTVRLENKDGKPLTVIVNHFTSQLQGEDGERRRLGQADHVASLARQEAANGGAVVVTGDLNEDEDGPAVRALKRDGNMIAVTDRLDAGDRYSYKRGRDYSLLDHVLIPENQDWRITNVRIPHINTEAPNGAEEDSSVPEGISDHDPVLATVRVSS